MKLFKAGAYANQGFYKSFHPTELNRQWYFKETYFVPIRFLWKK